MFISIIIMSSYDDQFKNLVKSWNLEINDVKLVSSLGSFHGIMNAIYQRNDTQQYIYISAENSYEDGVDDYFKWNYITEDEKNKEISKYKKLFEM